MFDLISFYETHPVSVTLAVLFGVGLFILAGREIRDLWTKHDVVVKSVLLQEDAVKDGPETIIHRKEIVAKITDLQQILKDLADKSSTHYADVEKLSNEEHWKNCPVDRCPNLPVLISNAKQNNEKLDLILEIFQKLSFELLALVREGRKGGPKNGR